jgi:hypothetical protein
MGVNYWHKTVRAFHDNAGVYTYRFICLFVYRLVPSSAEERAAVLTNQDY